MGVFDRLLRVGEGKKMRALESLVPDINALEPEMERLSEDAMRAKTVEFRQFLDNGGDLNDLLVEAFALVREGARRVIGQRHYDVQLMGGAALYFGWIAEMKTGEGKTLVSTLPAYLNGITGKGVHMVTVNDYLAKRDAEWMGLIHNFLGVSVGLIGSADVPRDERRAAYACDITYGTNTEFGFDYLRDNMARSKQAMVQRGHGFAIVDEVDSILIDEARTPLIISGPSAQGADLYNRFAAIARGLQRDVHYEVDEEKRTIAPLEDGIDKVEAELGVDNIYDEISSNYVHQLTQSIRAKELYKRDKDYIVADGEVKIVDEFTGRILEGRRWSDGLHQAVEAKERVKIKEENHTWATVTLQNYFRLYDKLSGMTGTAVTESAEFAGTYNLPVVPIPTHRPPKRRDDQDLIYKTENGKFNSAVQEILERNAEGQPVLVGTASVNKSEVLSRLLEKRGVPHTVLNAKQHTREAHVVAQAGRLGAVTVATNMAGRGVDILLGGNPEGLAEAEALAQGFEPETEEGKAIFDRLLPEFKKQCQIEGDKVRALGGLYVLGSERHESRRIDNQLRGRSGRQGDPGVSRFFLSLEDDLMRLFATRAVEWVMGRAFPEDQPLESKMVTKQIERAQNTVESRNAEIRKDVLKYDEVMDHQRKIIYRRRVQVLDGVDLKQETGDILGVAMESVVDAYCSADYFEEWDLNGLRQEANLYYPITLSTERLGEEQDKAALTELLTTDAITAYHKREDELPGGAEMLRELEREIMLQIIDQRWREHLAEMDYLREGINLRAMGQRDPLVEWQREGFEMFGQLMATIDDDYVKHVMHAQVVMETAEEPDFEQAEFAAPEDPVQGSSSMIGAAVREAESSGDPQQLIAAQAEQTMAPVVKSEREKIGRNDPCWCGSGKKFKLCHGA